MAGNQALFERMQAVVLAKCVRGHEGEYIRARIHDQEARHNKFGNSPFMQEPNIKNGCGGCATSRTCLDGILQVPGAVVG